MGNDRNKKVRKFRIFIFLSVLFVTWLGCMRDAPTDYSEMTIQSLLARISEEKSDIETHGKSAAALDGDRYWPYDRDRAALGMFLFNEHYNRWPESWEELLSAGTVDDETCIHDNWRLVPVDKGWEIYVENHGKIASLVEKQSD